MIVIRLASGEELTTSQFRARFKNIAFTGESPSAQYLDSIDAKVVRRHPLVGAAMVNQERLRRREGGAVVQVTGAGGIRLQGRDEDLANLQGLAFAAQLRLAQGDTTHQTKFRDMDNVDHMLVPAQVLEMWSLGSAWISDVYEASWGLKDVDPIPKDYTDDQYWP